MNEYEQKQALRRARLEDRAERLQREGDAKVKSGMNRLRAIPFGQPILVGHHSERRDRNYRSKAVGSIDKGMELRKEADEAARRAAAVGTGGISSDDPEAVRKLKEQLVDLERKQERMAAANKLVRKHKANPEAAVPELAKLGFSGGTAKALFEPDFCGRVGFASYQLTNNGANIRRIKARIEELQKNAGRETKKEEFPGGIELVENAEANRVQIFFPGKPSEAVRDMLKAAGFRWSPTEGAWQRQLNNSAVYWARDLIKKVAEKNEQ